MRIAVTGASGLIGSHLIPELEKNGHEVIPFTRDKSYSEKAIYWNPDIQIVEESKLNGVDVVIHLAGENIANKTWSDKQKEYLQSNRTNAVQTLNKAFKGIKEPPHTVIVASAIGYYGNTNGAPITEHDESGHGFASKLCMAIENEASKISEKIRVITPRIGIVLSPEGGALKKMIPSFKMYLGGKMGDGKQFMSWIDIEDAVNAFIFAIENKKIKGPVNFTSPQPVSNQRFSYALANAMKRPCAFTIPSIVVQTIFGQMGQELLLEGAQVQPKKLEDAGFKFKHTNIEECLNHQL